MTQGILCPNEFLVMFKASDDILKHINAFKSCRVIHLWMICFLNLLNSFQKKLKSIVNQITPNIAFNFQWHFCLFRPVACPLFSCVWSKYKYIQFKNVHYWFCCEFFRDSIGFCIKYYFCYSEWKKTAWSHPEWKKPAWNLESKKTTWAVFFSWLIWVKND